MSDERIYMLNALWFKKDGGAETYRRYLKAAGPIVQKLGARVVERYTPDLAIIGDWDPDLFFLVEWPDMATFESLLTNEDYLKIRHLREDALEKSLLIRCRKAP